MANSDINRGGLCGLAIDESQSFEDLSNEAACVLGAVAEQLQLIANDVYEDNPSLGGALFGTMSLSLMGNELAYAAFEKKRQSEGA